MLDKKHAVARRILTHNYIPFQEHLVAQLQEYGVDETGVTVLKHRRALQQAGTQNVENFLQQIKR